MRDRWFDVTIGYCPECGKNQFFAHTIGFSGRCPVCQTFVLNIYERPVEEGQDTIA